MAAKTSTTRMARKPRAKTPAVPRVRKKTDQAGRPTPPDRDGNGAAGGSLPGNETVAYAKGSANTLVLLAQNSVGQRTHHDIGVNGRQRRLKIGEPEEVTPAELEALEASHVAFEIVSLPETAGEDAVEGSSASSTEVVEEDAETKQEGDEPDKDEDKEEGEQKQEGSGDEAAATA